MEEHKEGISKEKVGSCLCETMPKDAEWDEKRWKQHWADQKKGHKERLDRLHKEALKNYEKTR